MSRERFIHKNIIRITAAGILFLSVVLAVFSVRGYAAEDTDPEDDFTYSGPLDPDTNEPVREEQSTDTGRVRLSDAMEYDVKAERYIYTANNGLVEIKSTVADGMFTRDAVSISTAADASIVVHKDGTILSGKVSTLTDPGEYIVSTQSGSDYTRLFSFTILGKTTNGLQHFTVPEGFYMTDAKLDGSGYYYTRYGADLAAEGEYVLSYVCGATERVYTLEITIDRTPPTLEFSGKINSENQVRSALEFTGVEPGGSVAVLQESNTYSVRPDSEGVYSLKDSGLYTIRVYDAAGNMTEYQYRIMMYFNISSIIFVLAAGLLLLGIGIYVIIRRRSLRIG